MESARAAAWQQQVLAQVDEAIDRQVQAAGEALRDAEDELVQTLGAQPQSDAYARWTQARTQRDAALAALVLLFVSAHARVSNPTAHHAQGRKPP